MTPAHFLVVSRYLRTGDGGELATLLCPDDRTECARGGSRDFAVALVNFRERDIRVALPQSPSTRGVIPKLAGLPPEGRRPKMRIEAHRAPLEWRGPQ